MNFRGMLPYQSKRSLLQKINYYIQSKLKIFSPKRSQSSSIKIENFQSETKSVQLQAQITAQETA